MSVKAIWRAMAALAVSCFAVWIIGIQEWTLIPALVGFGALLSILFDFRRIVSRFLILERIQFNSRKIEWKHREEPRGDERTRALVFDALGSIVVAKNTIGFYAIDADYPIEVLAFAEFEEIGSLEKFLITLKKGRANMYIRDDSLEEVDPDLVAYLKQPS